MSPAKARCRQDPDPGSQPGQAPAAARNLGHDPRLCRPACLPPFDVLGPRHRGKRQASPPAGSTRPAGNWSRPPRPAPARPAAGAPGSPGSTTPGGAWGSPARSPGVLLPAPVPVAGVHPVRRDLPVPRVAADLDVGVHHPLGELPDHLPQHIRARRCQGLLKQHAGNRHNVTYGHFALLRCTETTSKDREVGRLASRRHAVLRQLRHLSTGYPIHHFRERELRRSGQPRGPGFTSGPRGAVPRPRLRPALSGHRQGKSCSSAAGRVRPGAAGTSPPAISLAEHRVEFGVGPDRPDLLRAAAGDGDLGSPPQRLLA